MCAQLFRHSFSFFFIACSVATAFDGCVRAEDAWGTIKGRIVYSEAPPTAEKITVERDPAVCGLAGLVNESLVVHEKNRGIRDIAIWLDTRAALPVHPDLINPPVDAPVMDNLNCRFTPRMMAVRTGQVFELKNSDPIAHNAAVYARRNSPFSEIIPMNQPLQKKFAKFENLPVRVDCSIHPWMKAWLVVLEHPYVAVSGDDGSFEIANVPVGEWKFRFWHERPGYLQKLIKGDQSAPLEKGSWVINVTGEQTLDLGELIAPADQFRSEKK